MFKGLKNEIGAMLVEKVVKTFTTRVCRIQKQMLNDIIAVEYDETEINELVEQHVLTIKILLEDAAVVINKGFKLSPVQPKIIKQYVLKKITEVSDLIETSEYKQLYVDTIRLFKTESVVKNEVQFLAMLLNEHHSDYDKLAEKVYDYYNELSSDTIEKFYSKIAPITYKSLVVSEKIILDIIDDWIGDGYVYDNLLSNLGMSYEFIYRLHKSIETKKMMLTVDDLKDWYMVSSEILTLATREKLK